MRHELKNRDASKSGRVYSFSSIIHAPLGEFRLTSGGKGTAYVHFKNGIQLAPKSLCSGLPYSYTSYNNKINADGIREAINLFKSHATGPRNALC